MGKLIRNLFVGAAAGAAGTTALNAATYVDMVVRARPASSTPQETVRKLSESTGIAIPGDDEQQKNRIEGLGPLLGISAGVLTGAVLGVARGLGWRPSAFTAALVPAAVALVAGNAPMTVLKVTDPRKWSASDWVSDVLPHLAFGVTAGSILRSPHDH